MPCGFCSSGKTTVEGFGGDFAEAGGVPLLRSSFKTLSASTPKGCVVGVDIGAFSVDQVFLPDSSREKLDEALALQAELRAGGAQFWSRSLTEKSEKGAVGILSLAIPPFPLPPKAKLYPSFAGLYALAWRKGLFKPGTAAFVLLACGGRVLCLAVSGETVVFSRSFQDDEAFDANVKLSLQEVYFSKERRFFKPVTAALFGASQEDAKRLEKALGGSTPVTFIDISSWFSDSSLEPRTRFDAVLAYGLSLAPKSKPLAVWNVLGSSGMNFLKNKWFLARCAALLLVAPLAVFAAELLSDKILLARLSTSEASLRPLYARLLGIENDSSALKLFASRQGSSLIGQDLCFDLFKAMDEARPSGLVFSSLAGSPTGPVSANGSAPSYGAVMTFIERLSKSPAVETVELVSASLSENGMVAFQVLLKCKIPKEFVKPKPRGEDGEGSL